MTRRFTVGQAEAFGRQSTAPLGVARAIGRVPCRATDQSVVDVTLTTKQVSVRLFLYFKNRAVVSTTPGTPSRRASYVNSGH